MDTDEARILMNPKPTACGRGRRTLPLPAASHVALNVKNLRKKPCFEMFAAPNARFGLRFENGSHSGGVCGIVGI